MLDLHNSTYSVEYRINWRDRRPVSSTNACVLSVKVGALSRGSGESYTTYHEPGLRN